ncbi:MAG: DNA gyrase/topoisomerase IV subunit A, partial [Bacteroidia bacterium]
MATENNSSESSLMVSGMYETYFLDYASYVILERAVPLLFDGLKPVQRRILHSMKEMDDGRFNKVANIIGQTMQYHPHGDAAIGEALVNMGQKDLMVETQGNWGDVRTGDSAAASRYIEARLSKFALEVSFNPKNTEWSLSYDGRKREPVALPMKFPLVLAQGVEGIAVGLSTKIMPHNFCELIEASIEVLQGKTTLLLPDFPTGGTMDASNYNSGRRGGKVRCRGTIESPNKNTLLITSLPFGVTTGSLIESVIKANDKGKIKIKKITDNTAKNVEIVIELPPNISPDVTIDALYAFTECEVSISPSACVIIKDKPYFLSVDELLKLSTQNTLELLKKELEIQLAELKERLLFSSLEKIFIEKRIYRKIEECETWESVIETIDKALTPYKKQFYRTITEDDIVRLTEIKIKRISKFDSFKADELMRDLEKQISDIEHHLANLVGYAIQYFRNLLAKYGKTRERKTQIKSFDTIEISQVAVANQKLYVNRKDGFIGYGLKKEEYVCDCSDIDDIIVFLADGKWKVVKVSEKAFVGKDILHIDVWKKNNERMVYHAAYRDAETGVNYVKRFSVTAIIRDKEYDITRGTKGSKLLYFSANPNGETEIIGVLLSQNCTAKNKSMEFDFSTLGIKGRDAMGNQLTKYPIRKIVRKSVGASSLGGRKIWYDNIVGRLNSDERGRYLGEFDTSDKILVIFKDGSYELTNFEPTNRYDQEKSLIIEKFEADNPISVVHYDGKTKEYYVKRFLIETTTEGKTFSFISAEAGSKLLFVSTEADAKIEYTFSKPGSKAKETARIVLNEFIEVKGWKALGNKLDVKNKVLAVRGLESVEQLAQKQ